VGEEYRLEVFENRVLRRMFGPLQTRYQENGEDYITGSFVICTPHQLLQGSSNQE
jgi:hypothetical protein